MTEDKNFQENLDKAKELESIDFTSVEKIDYVAYYGAIEKIANKNSTLKNEEAENVIAEYGPVYLEPSVIQDIIKKRESIINFIKLYDPNTDLVKTMEIHDVDKVYAINNYLLNAMIKLLNEMPFNFVLTVEEFKWLDKVLTNTIEYNGDDVFNYDDLYEKFWKSAKEVHEANKIGPSYTFKINIKTILILHHLIKGFTVKGRGGEFRLFKSVLYKIAQTNKLFNAYSIIVERIKDVAKLWGSGIEEVLKPKEEILEKQAEQSIGQPVQELKS